MTITFIKQPLYFKDQLFEFNDEFKEAFNNPLDIIKSEKDIIMVIYPAKSPLIEHFYYLWIIEGMYDFDYDTQMYKEYNPDALSMLVIIDLVEYYFLPISFNYNHRHELEVLVYIKPIQ